MSNYIVKPETAALIKVISDTPMGADKLVMWSGYPHDVDYDGAKEVDCSKVSVLNAKSYKYPDCEIIYSYGKAHQVDIGCETLRGGVDCYCTGACRADAPIDLQVDSHYFSKRNNHETEKLSKE